MTANIKNAPDYESKVINLSTRSVIQKISELKKFVVYSPDKIPLSAKNGKYTDITKTENLVDYKTAQKKLKRIRRACGIGIVLGNTPFGTLSCIDIDGCIKNDVIAPEAIRIIEYFKSYTEISLSGTGIHIFFFAKKPGTKCKIKGFKWCKCIEMYDTENRFIALTLNKISDFDIENRQEECTKFYNRYFLSPKYKEVIKTHSFKQINKDTNEIIKIALIKDKRFANYYNGIRPFSDESANDNGFMAKLMYWFKNDIETAISVFKDSPFAKSKDDRHIKKMNRKDYLFMTAQNSVYKGAL